MKNLKDFINEASFKTKNRAEDLKVGDKIMYIFSDPKINNGKPQKIMGVVDDHFDDGVMIMLDRSLEYFDLADHNKNQGTYNYQEWARKKKTKSFELFNDEDNDWGNLDCLKIYK